MPEVQQPIGTPWPPGLGVSECALRIARDTKTDESSSYAEIAREKGVWVRKPAHPDVRRGPRSNSRHALQRSSGFLAVRTGAEVDLILRQCACKEQDGVAS